MKKLPVGFNVHAKPYPPVKPPEKLVSNTVIKTFEASSYGNINIADLMADGGDSISVESRERWGDTEITISVYSPNKEIPNPNYANLIKVYNKQFKEYTKKLNEYNENKAIYDKIQENKKKKEDRALYEKLKEEFGE